MTVAGIVPVITFILAFSTVTETSRVLKDSRWRLPVLSPKHVESSALVGCTGQTEHDPTTQKRSLATRDSSIKSLKSSGRTLISKAKENAMK
jgi:hypothetical protein